MKRRIVKNATMVSLLALTVAISACDSNDDADPVTPAATAGDTTSTAGGTTDGVADDDGMGDTTADGEADGGEADGGEADGGAADGGEADGGAADGGEADGGAADGGEADGGEADGGEADGGEADGGEADGGEADGGEADGGEADGGEADGGEADGGAADGGEADGGAADGGEADGGAADGGEADGGEADGGAADGGEADGGAADGGEADGGAADGGEADGGAADGGSADGGSADGGEADGGEADGGAADGGESDGGSTDGGSDGGPAGSLTVSFTNTSATMPMTPPVVALHNAPGADKGIRLFEVGQPAVLEVVEIAENGDNNPLVSRAVAEIQNGTVSAAGVAFTDADNPGPLLPGASASVNLDLAGEDQVLSIISMIVCSNDGFSGIDSRPLSAEASDTFRAPIYDAGSETNVLTLEYWVPPCGGEGNRGDDENGSIMAHPGQSGSENPDFDFEAGAELLEITVTRN